ncbi:hypothetical protein BKA18_002423 [Streptomyces auratus]
MAITRIPRTIAHAGNPRIESAATNPAQNAPHSKSRTQQMLAKPTPDSNPVTTAITQTP